MSDLTIRDIAKIAGVSTTAVSFVLNNRPGVSDATRQHVQEVIARTGFTPNVHTRRLNLGRSFSVHVVLYWHEHDLFNQFALEILHGVFQSCKQLGYSVVFTFVEKNMDCSQLMASIRSKDCDGVILSQIEDPLFITLLQQEHIPFVCVDSHVRRDGTLPLVNSAAVTRDTPITRPPMILSCICGAAGTQKLAILPRLSLWSCIFPHFPAIRMPCATVL